MAKLSWPAGWASVCCCRVGDPQWQTTGRPEVIRPCRNCRRDLIVEEDLIRKVQAAYGAAWDFVCVECYVTNRAPVEIHNRDWDGRAL
jgi:hypothetical protein